MSKSPPEKDKAEKELVRDIASAWAGAQRQLEKLKASVEENQRLSTARRELEEAQRHRDQALADLGRAALEYFEATPVAAELEPAVKLAKMSQARLAAQKSAIADLLAESEVAGGAEKAAKKRK